VDDEPLNDAAAPILSIGTVSRFTKLSPRQIRYYEKLGLVRPVRSRGNHRLYSKLDVDRLILIRDLLNSGLGFAAIRSLIEGSTKEDEREYWAELLAAHLPDRGRRTSPFPAASPADLIRRLSYYERYHEKAQGDRGKQ